MSYLGTFQSPLSIFSESQVRFLKITIYLIVCIVNISLGPGMGSMICYALLLLGHCLPLHLKFFNLLLLHCYLLLSITLDISFYYFLFLMLTQTQLFSYSQVFSSFYFKCNKYYQK